MSDRKFNIGDKVIEARGLKNRIINDGIGDLRASKPIIKITEDADGVYYMLESGSNWLGADKLIAPDEALKTALEYVAELFQRIIDAKGVKS